MEEYEGEVVEGLLPTWAPTGVVETPGETPFASMIHGTWTEVRATLVTNGVLGVVLWVFFELKRGRRSIFGPRLREWGPGSKLRAIWAAGVRRVPLEWATSLKGLSEDELRSAVGVDAYLVLRFCRAWRRVFAFAGLGAGVLCWIYAKGGAKRRGFFKFTLANGRNDKKSLWAATVFLWLWSGFILRILEAEARHCLETRKQWLADTSAQDQTRCSVLLERVPWEADPTTLARYLNFLLGDANAVAGVVVYDRDALKRLAGLVQKRQAAAAHVQRLAERGSLSSQSSQSSQSSSSRRRTPTTKLRKAADALDGLDAACAEAARDATGERRSSSFPKKHDECESEFDLESAHASGALKAGALEVMREAAADTFCCCVRSSTQTSGALKTAIATLASPGLASDAAQLALTSEPLGLEAGPAPPPNDLIWSNVACQREAVELRRAVADVALLGAALCFAPFVSAIQLVSNLDAIAVVLPRLRPLFERHSALLAGLVTGYLPVVLLLAVFTVVPIGLEILAARYIRFKSRARLQSYVLPRFFAFQMLAIFVTVLAGSLLSALQLLATRPGAVVGLLGRAVPSAGPYFLQYLIVKICFSLPLELAQLGPYLIADALRKSKRLYRALAGARPREERENRDETTAPRPSSQPDEAFPLARASSGCAVEQQSTSRPQPTTLRMGVYVVPELLMVVTLGALCAPTAPLVAVLAWIYMSLADAVFTRQFLFVYSRDHDSGGRDLWPSVLSCSVYALLVAQLAALCTVSLLGGWTQALFFVPLPLLTHVFHAHFLVPYFVLPAATLDRHTVQACHLFAPVDPAAFRPDYYQHPAVRDAGLALDSRTLLRGLSQHDDNDDDDDDDPIPSSSSTTKPTALERTHLLGAAGGGASPGGASTSTGGDIALAPLRAT